MEPFDRRNNEDYQVKGREFMRNLRERFQIYMDKVTPYPLYRWLFSVSALLIFMYRVYSYNQWYVICYALGIYYLNLVIDFLSPRIDPEFQAAQEDLDPDSGPSLPTRVNDEFRPFIRRLPEFKFWFLGTRATLVSLFLGLFDIFDMEVYWPILVLYFFILLFLTLRRQIQHMRKHNYVPWTTNKRRYNQS